MHTISRMAHDPVAVLRAAMDAKGWNESQLAQISGVDQSLISRYLNKKAEVGAKSGVRLARALGVEIESILGKSYAA